MAEKKVKIDLKSRLGRASSSANPQAPAPQPGGIPAPTGIAPPPGIMTPGGIPAPPFQARPSGPKVDKADPFAAVSADEVPQQKAAEIKLEISQDVIQQAQKSSRKGALIAGLIGAVVFGALGFVWGGMNEKGSQNKVAVQNAQELVTDIDKVAKDVKAINEKLAAAHKTLFTEKKFPETIGAELKAIKLSFDASNLSGKNISRFKPATMRGLVDFASGVQDLDKRRERLASLFDNKKKDIVALLDAGQNPRMSYSVFIGKSEKGAVATFAKIKDPIEFSKPWPDKFSIVGVGENVEVERFKSGEPFVKPGVGANAKPTVYGVPIEPDGITRVFPNDLSTRIQTEVGGAMQVMNGVTGGGVDNETTGLIKLGEDLVKDLKEIGKKR